MYIEGTSMSYDCFDGGNNVAAIPNTEAEFEANAADIAHAEGTAVAANIEEDATNVTPPRSAKDDECLQDERWGTMLM